MAAHDSSRVGRGSSVGAGLTTAGGGVLALLWLLLLPLNWSPSSRDQCGKPPSSTNVPAAEKPRDGVQESCCGREPRQRILPSSCCCTIALVQHMLIKSTGPLQEPGCVQRIGGRPDSHAAGVAAGDPRFTWSDSFPTYQAHQAPSRGSAVTQMHAIHGSC